MKLDERRRNVSFWSETIESARLVIPAKAGISLSLCHPEQRKGSMEDVL